MLWTWFNSGFQLSLSLVEFTRGDGPPKPSQGIGRLSLPRASFLLPCLVHALRFDGTRLSTYGTVMGGNLCMCKGLGIAAACVCVWAVPSPRVAGPARPPERVRLRAIGKNPLGSIWLGSGNPSPSQVYENAAPHRAPHRARPTPLAHPTDTHLPRYPTPQGRYLPP